MRKTLMTAVATPPGDFATELQSASGFGISHTVFRNMSQYFFMQGQNTKETKEFRVKVQTPLLVCSAEAFKTQSILCIIK